MRVEPAAGTPLLAGAEVAAATGFAALRGARVAVLGNPTSLIRRARGGRIHLVDALLAAGVQVVKLFGPEHGIWATAQDMVGVDAGRDPIFNLPVETLYGHDETSLIPRPETLAGIDVLVFDVQDVGARYYTYAATLCMALDICAAAGVAVTVFDRPNPLGGEQVEGGRVAADHRSFVGWLDLPQRHGLTVGEIARLHVAEVGLQVSLEVVPCTGWRVADYLDEQFHGELPPLWTPPSPNMPTVQTAVLYPGLCLLEATSMSEGRGTTRPFELIGAPGIDARAFAEAICATTDGEIDARPLMFEPTFQKHTRICCGGAVLEVPDRRRLRSVRAGVGIIAAAMDTFGDAFGWRTEAYEFVTDRPAFDLLMGGPHARRVLRSSADVDAACAGFDEAGQALGRRTRGLLLYPRGGGVFAPKARV